MRFSSTAVIGAALFVWSTCSTAQELVIFNSGETASAADINQNFQILEDRINDRHAARFGAEWYLQPSVDGAKSARNVIVLKGDLGGSSGCDQDFYLVRTHFTNTESLSVANASGSVVPDFIFTTSIVCTPRGVPTTVNYQSEYVYALPDDPGSTNPRGAWESAEGVEINEDFDGDGQLDDQNNAYDYALTWAPNPMENGVLSQEIEVYRNGNQNLAVNDFSSLTKVFPLPIELPAPVARTYSDVIVETHSGYGVGNSWIRFHARDIGAIQLTRDAEFGDPIYGNQAILNAVYYRIDGVEAGSLAGTPFEGANPSAGLWFTP